MFCSKCGAEVKEGARFCPKCGAPIVSDNLSKRKVEPQQDYKDTLNADKNSHGAGNHKTAWIILAIVIIAAVIVIIVLGLSRRSSVKETDAMEDHLELGMKYLEENDYGEAVSEFADALDIESNMQAYYYLAESYMDMGDPDMAAEVYGEAVEYALDVYEETGVVPEFTEEIHEAALVYEDTYGDIERFDELADVMSSLPQGKEIQDVASDEDFVPYFVENDIEMTSQGEITLGVAGSLNSDYDVEGTVKLFATLETVDSDEEGYLDTILTLASQGNDLVYGAVYNINVGMCDYYTGEMLFPDYSDTDWGESEFYEFYVTMPDGTLCACSCETFTSDLTGNAEIVYTLHHPTEYDGAVFEVTGSSLDDLANDDAIKEADADSVHFIDNVEESMEYVEEYGLDSYFFRDSPSDYGTGENSYISKVSIGGVEFIPDFVKMGCEITHEGSVEMNVYGDLDGDGLYETPGSCTVYVTIETVPSTEDGYSDTIATLTGGEGNFNGKDEPYGLTFAFVDYYTGEKLQDTIILPDGTEYSCYWDSEKEINEEGEIVFTITAHHPSDYDGAVFCLRGRNPLADGDLTIEDVGENPTTFIDTYYFMSTDISADNTP